MFNEIADFRCLFRSKEKIIYLLLMFLVLKNAIIFTLPT